MAVWVSTAEQREDAWKFCAGAIERHFEERLKRWNAELDMLLVFVRVHICLYRSSVVDLLTTLRLR